MKADQKTALIEVSGGVAEITHCDEGVRVVIIDWDGVEAGDEPGYPRPTKGDKSPLATALRKAWKIYDKTTQDA